MPEEVWVLEVSLATQLYLTAVGIIVGYVILWLMFMWTYTMVSCLSDLANIRL